MPGRQVLARRYARLLRCYPRWYRRERGFEMLSTYLDTAPPGRRRPGRADIVDVLRGALRARVRVHGTVARLVGVAVLVLTAGVGSALAVRLSDYPGPPTRAAAATVAGTATGSSPGELMICTWRCPGPPDPADVPPEHLDVAIASYDARTAGLSGAGTRLAAAGWRTVRREPAELEAVREGLRVTLYATGDRTFVVVSKNATATAVSLAAGGFLAGALSGWLVHVWAVQRYRRHRRAVRATVLAAAGVIVLVTGWLAMRAALLGLLLTVERDWGPDGTPPGEFALLMLPGPYLAAAGILALGALALPTGRGPQPRRANVAGVAWNRFLNDRMK